MELNFNDLLKEMRRKKGISQASLASRTKLSQAFFVKIEKHNTIPNSENFVKILEALQVSYDELKQLTIEYSKLVKPQQVQDLITKDFAKSEYIISLLLDKMHFKSSFLDLYRNISLDSTNLLYGLFIDIIYHFAECLDINIYYLSITDFFKCIDILKEKSDRLYDFNINKLPQEITERLPNLSWKNFKYYTKKGIIKGLVRHSSLFNSSKNTLEMNTSPIFENFSKGNFIQINSGEWLEVYFVPLFKGKEIFDIITQSPEKAFDMRVSKLAGLYKKLFKVLDNKSLIKLIDGEIEFLDNIISELTIYENLQDIKELQQENQTLKQRLEELEKGKK